MAKVTITSKQKAKINRAVKALNEVRQEVANENPNNDINWYLEDCENLNFMEDSPHDDENNAREDRVIHLVNLHNASGGGW